MPSSSFRRHSTLLRSAWLTWAWLANWADGVAKQHGYTDISHTLEVFGLCPDCSPADPATG